MSHADDIVSVYRGANNSDAFMIRNALIDEGIECQVTEVNEPFAGLSVAQPDVLVRASDEKRARAIIERLEATQARHAGDPEEPDEESDE